MSNHWDVIIIGGGPAGSSAATTLAKEGRRVLLLEKEKFPRFHVGESLLPYNCEVMEKLGVLEKIRQAGFMPKRGAQFWMGDGSRHVQFVFGEGSFTDVPEAFEVERSKFDQLLLEHSRSCGAEVREQSAVLEYEVLKDEVRVKYRDAEGGEHEVRAPFLMDASGLSNFTGTREKLREYYPSHKKLALFSHFEGVDMPTGERRGDILIVRRNNSWWWMIPLEDNKTSVGLVLDKGDFEPGRKPQEIFDEAVRTTKVLRDRLANARQQIPLNVVSDFSYRNGKLVSPRLVRVGDASGFIDPIFSSGVLLAMTSGVEGAEAVDVSLSAGQAMTSPMRQYERVNRGRISQYWEFIENFYTVPFTQIFFQPENKLKMVCAINAVLAGRYPLPFNAWWRLRVFFFLVWLQKHYSVARRIRIRSDVPQTAAS